jgi:hypothetical protein
MKTPPTPPNLWQERYESLRRYFVDGRRELETDPLSLTVLLQQGLAGWMRAWRHSATAQPNPPSSSSPPLDCPMGPIWQQQLTHLIAHMTLNQIHHPPPSL